MDTRKRAIRESAERRAWLIEGFVLLSDENEEKETTLGKEVLSVIVEFSGDETPDGGLQQFSLLIPLDAIIRQEKITREGKDDSSQSRDMRRIYIREDTMIWQEVMRPIHLRLIDTTTQVLPAKLNLKDFNRGLGLMAIPSSYPERGKAFPPPEN